MLLKLGVHRCFQCTKPRTSGRDEETRSCHMGMERRDGQAPSVQTMKSEASKRYPYSREASALQNGMTRQRQVCKKPVEKKEGKPSSSIINVPFDLFFP